MNKKVNAKRIASAKFRKAKNKEIALANNLFLAFPAGIEPTVYRLGVQSPCESFVKNVQFRAFWCIFVKNVRCFILKISFSVT